jgi:ribonuclease D
MNTKENLSENKEKTQPAEEFDIALSREDINALPIQKYEGPIVVVEDENAAVQAADALLREQVVGFDTETRPSFRKGESYPPALIQMAGSTCVYLFPLATGHFSGPLRTVLEAATPIKVGVALAHDVKKLVELDAFEPAGFVSVEPLTRALRIKNQGLRGLSAALLGFRVSKRAQCSNWSRLPLTQAQIDYAATDAWISRVVYLEMVKRLQKKGIPLPG